MVYIATPAVVNRFTFAAFISLGFNFVWIERNMMCKMCVYMKAVLSSKRMYATLTCFVPNKQKNQINKKIKRKWPERIDLLLFLWFFFSLTQILQILMFILAAQLLFKESLFLVK